MIESPDGILATSEPPEFLPEPSAAMAPLAVLLALARLHALRSGRHDRGAKHRNGGTRPVARQEYER